MLGLVLLLPLPLVMGVMDVEVGVLLLLLLLLLVLRRMGFDEVGSMGFWDGNCEGGDERMEVESRERVNWWVEGEVKFGDVSSWLLLSPLIFEWFVRADFVGVVWLDLD